MILVTGGTGLLGTHLLLHLIREGNKVRATYREANSLPRVKHIFSYYSPDAETLFGKIDWIMGDINDLMALEAAFKGVTHVYHCAALISFDPRDFTRLKKINTEGTANIVNFCLAYGVQKLCYASSTATVGRPLSSEMATEEDFGPDRHPGVYAISKELAELEVWRGSQEGLEVVIVNPGIILGPGFWQKGSGVLFGMAARGSIIVPPGGTGFVAVADVVEIMVQLMQSTLQNERYIVVGKNLTYKEILTIIGKEFNLPGPKFILPRWLLQLLWRADWLRCRLFGGSRKLTKSSVVSLKNPVEYNNAKVRGALSYRFSPLEETIEFSCRQFIEENPGLVK